MHILLSDLQSVESNVTFEWDSIDFCHGIKSGARFELWIVDDGDSTQHLSWSAVRYCTVRSNCWQCTRNCSRLGLPDERYKTIAKRSKFTLPVSSWLFVVVLSVILLLIVQCGIARFLCTMRVFEVQNSCIILIP